MTPRPTWLRAMRNCRYFTHHLCMLVVNVAGAFAAVGIAWAIWLIISGVVERATPPVTPVSSGAADITTPASHNYRK